MTPADRRITELIDKWLTSVDLHLKYAELSDAAYARAQPWPKHDRPTRWVLEVARQKILELKAHCETRQSMGDSRFAEALELMAFLANLVGIQHIQRFVPLADPAREETLSSSASQTVEAPVAPRASPARPRASDDETTREMPRPPVAKAPAAGEDTTREMPRLKAAAPAAKPSVQSKPAEPVKAPARAASPSKSDASGKAFSADLKSKMIADAVRLLKWGKPWHELAELIGRIADRPPVPDIRKFLRANKAEIEARAAQSS
jgi:hypothetical protein